MRVCLLVFFPRTGCFRPLAVEMNPVNATTLYVSACRSVLQCDPRDPRALAELYKLLPFFRQSLSCLVCGRCTGIIILTASVSL